MTSAAAPYELGRASFVYALGGLAYKGVALLSVPIIARLLTPSELGVLDVAAVVASLIAVVVSVGVDQALPFWESRSEDESGVWGAALFTVIGGGFLAVLVAGMTRDWAASLLFSRPDLGAAVAAAGIYGACMAVSGLALVTLRLRASARAYTFAAFLTVLFEMTGALLVAWFVETPVALMVLAWAAGSALVSLPVLRRYLPGLRRPHRNTVGRLIGFGWPLVPAALAWLVGDLWIRGTLGREGDLVALGEYGVAFRIASVPALLVGGFSVAWYTSVYQGADVGSSRIAHDALWKVPIAIGGVAIGLTLLAPELVAIIAGPAYVRAETVVAPLLGGTVAMGMFHVVAGLVGRTGSTRRVGTAAAIGMVLQAIGAAALVPALGLVGAGLASLAGQVGALTAVVIIGRPEVALKRAPMVATLAVVGLGLVVAHMSLGAPIGLRIVAATAAIGASVAAALLLTGEVDKAR